MGWFLFIIGVAVFIGKKIKEMREPTIPASYWRNKDLMYKDQLNPNISPQQVMKNLENGKYYISDEEFEKRK